jgi:hypothetical protein
MRTPLVGENRLHTELQEYLTTPEPRPPFTLTQPYPSGAETWIINDINLIDGEIYQGKEKIYNKEGELCTTTLQYHLEGQDQEEGEIHIHRRSSAAKAKTPIHSSTDKKASEPSKENMIFSVIFGMAFVTLSTLFVAGEISGIFNVIAIGFSAIACIAFAYEHSNHLKGATSPKDYGHHQPSNTLNNKDDIKHTPVTPHNERRVTFNHEAQTDDDTTSPLKK